MPTLGWLLCLPIHWKPSKIKAPSLSLFLSLRRSIRHPQMMGKRPPLHVLPCCIASPTSHPPPKSSFGGLLCSFIEWQPPKTDAPSISQFFAGCHWGAPIKLFHHSEPKPVRRVPAMVLQGAVAPRFGPMADGSMEREGEAAEGRVAGST